MKYCPACQMARRTCSWCRCSPCTRRRCSPRRWMLSSPRRPLLLSWQCFRWTDPVGLIMTTPSDKGQDRSRDVKTSCTEQLQQKSFSFSLKFTAMSRLGIWEKNRVRFSLPRLLLSADRIRQLQRRSWRRWVDLESADLGPGKPAAAPSHQMLQLQTA